jgi:recombination protein RecA
MNSKFCLKVKGLLAIHNTTLFIVSQTRDNIGGNTGEVTTGGKAIKFYSDVRWKLWKSADKVNELNKTTIDVIKSKIGKPFGQAKINILWGVGIDRVAEVVEYADELGFIKIGGAWYEIEGTKIQGMNKVREFMEDNPEYFEDLSRRVREAVIPKGKLVDRE